MNIKQIALLALGLISAVMLPSCESMGPLIVVQAPGGGRPMRVHPGMLASNHGRVQKSWHGGGGSGSYHPTLPRTSRPAYGRPMMPRPGYVQQRPGGYGSQGGNPYGQQSPARGVRFYSGSHLGSITTMGPAQIRGWNGGY